MLNNRVANILIVIVVIAAVVNFILDAALPEYEASVALSSAFLGIMGLLLGSKNGKPPNGNGSSGATP